ncbi:MAG: hypothetical protein ABIH23_18970, partial [bacterium]
MTKSKRESLKNKPRGGRRSDSKGAAFERAVCRRLSLWISRGESKNLFWRSSLSGGRATTLRRKGENLNVHAGDIAAIDSAGERFIKTFFVECKAYKTLRFDSLVYPVKGVIGTMWNKCVRQADGYNKLPLMIVKENGKPWLLIADGGPINMCGLVMASFPGRGMYVYLLDDVLKLDPAEFIQGGENA